MALLDQYRFHRSGLVY